MENESVVLVTRDYKQSGITFHQGQLLFLRDDWWCYNKRVLYGNKSIAARELEDKGIIIPATEVARLLYEK